MKWANRSFHKRYMVLRGFDLYWYRDEDRSVKGMVTLLSNDIEYPHKAYGGKRCFVIATQNNRELKEMLFKDSSDNNEYKEFFDKMITFKAYIEDSIKMNQHLDTKLVQYIIQEKKPDSIVFIK